MRVLTGYAFIILSIPILAFTVILATSEISSVKSFHEVLDEKIAIDGPSLSQSSYIKDRNGQVISEIHRPVNRIYIPLNEIPTFIKTIFIVSEDQQFYQHPGFDLTAMGRAMAVNIQAKGIEEGASTITQQLARNLYLSYEQTYNRKISEILYAYQLERTYDKDEILELYLNSIFFNYNAYGIEAAAQLYFQKKAIELSNAEQAFLAAIPNNPSFYDPIQYFDRTKARQERLIDQLVEYGYLNKDEASEIKAVPIHITLKKRIDLYPDYTTYVENELTELIAYSDGLNQSGELDTEDQLKTHVNEVISSGIIIETALQPEVQENAVAAVKHYLPYNGIEGSVTVIDHEKHEVISIVGGKNYKKYDFHRAFQAYRQPGSSIKPILVYAPYFERTKASVTSRVNAGPFCVEEYCPENYGGANYGMVTIQNAFIHSYNTPAVRILHEIGVQNGFKDLSLFQFKKLVKEDYRLPAAIGGFTYGMTSLELTNAYTTFATGGYYKPSRAIRQVTDLSGNILYKWEEEPKQLWNAGTVSKMRTLLNKAVVSGTGRNANFQANYIGGKTGTTNNFYDYWFVGMTDKITAGVWIGKDHPESIKSVEAATPHLSIWKEIVSNINAK